MITQVWECKSIPIFIPDFVDKHICEDYDPFTGKKIYLIETNPRHPIFKDSKNVNESVKTLLTKSGFTNVSLIYHGEKPEFLVNHDH